MYWLCHSKENLAFSTLTKGTMYRVYLNILKSTQINKNKRVKWK